MANAQPKCPSCEIQGLEYIISKESNEQAKSGDAWFNIVHCDSCGHVYGVFNKVSISPSTPSMIPGNFFGND